MSTITTFVTAFDAKALNCTELWKYYLAGGNRILLTATGKPTEIATIDIVDKTHGLRFLLESHHFFPSCVQKKKSKQKNKDTVSMQYLWRHKDFKAQYEDHVAARLPRRL